MPRISSIACAEGSNGDKWVPLREGKVTQHLLLKNKSQSCTRENTLQKITTLHFAFSERHLKCSKKKKIIVKGACFCSLSPKAFASLEAKKHWQRALD